LSVLFTGLITKKSTTFSFDPYLVVWHRNHLGILTNNPLNMMAVGVYSYDFTSGSSQAYLNGQTNLGGGIYGIYSGDAKPDGSINNLDKLIWVGEAGTTGYKAPDLNMDTQVDNVDKNDNWLPNVGKGTQVPN
jgi:hypothetical protein